MAYVACNSLILREGAGLQALDKETKEEPPAVEGAAEIVKAEDMKEEKPAAETEEVAEKEEEEEGTPKKVAGRGKKGRAAPARGRGRSARGRGRKVRAQLHSYFARWLYHILCSSRTHVLCLASALSLVSDGNTFEVHMRKRVLLICRQRPRETRNLKRRRPRMA